MREGEEDVTAPPPSGEGGAMLGRVLTSLASRRHDDRDKMATLPGGIQGLYPEALSPEQLEKLRGFKIQTRITNEKYLRTHKEVELLISGFFRRKKTSFMGGCSAPTLTSLLFCISTCTRCYGKIY
ncbi:RIIa domain-containing protein 1 isoform X3 [Kogia breviceps]|uniref:RIIa domain-containing protein 1 isoform X3 n=1 Tax=Kogia breviceps TaxID=27615 RepID=UPI0034D15B0A